MNLKAICDRCGHTRGEHRGGTHQGACPAYSKFIADRVIRGLPPLSYTQRSWKPGHYGLPGGGPWRIDPACKAPTHNTMWSVEKRGNPRKILCICPHGKALIGQRMQRMQAKLVKIGKPMKIEGVQPKMEDPHCQGSPLLLKIVDAAYDGPSGYPAMQKICRGCPLSQEACLQYVATQEKPAGSWGGVWAGMTPRQRQKAFS